MKNDLQKRITIACVNLGITQKEIAERLEISPALLSLILQGERSVTEGFLLRLSAVVNITFDELLTLFTPNPTTYRHRT